MPFNIGPMELLVLLVMIAVFVAILVAVLRRA